MEEDLSLLECPFTWNVPDVPLRDEFMEKLKNKEDQSSFLMNGFTVKLLECFERFRSGEEAVAIRKVKELKTEMEEYIPVGLYAATDKYTWERSEEGMQHILFSTQAYLAFKTNDLETLDEIIKKIKPAESLDDSNKSAICGIKCRFFMEYGPFETTEKAITFIREAIKLDKTIPLWHFYLGKCLARYRRANAYNDPPSDEEIKELKIAFSESRTPDKAVMLLESYGEILKCKFVPNRTEVELKCRELLNMIQETTGDEWYVYWRCAHLSMRLPQKLIHKKEIKALIDMAVESSDRNNNTDKAFIYSIQCVFYKRYEKNYNMALGFGEKAAKSGDFPSALEVISIKYSLHEEEDLIPTIDGFINQANLKKKQDQLFIIKANYLFFVKKQIHEAFDIYFRVMEADPKNYILLNCRALFKEAYSRGYSVYDKVSNELIKIIAQNPKHRNNSVYEGFNKKLLEFKQKSSEK